MIKDKLYQLDYKYSNYFASLINFDHWTRTVLLFYSHTGSAIFWTILSGLGLIIFPKYRLEFSSLLIVTIIMMVTVYILKHLIKRPRPDFKDTRFGSVIFDEYSFPSGHGTRATYHFLLLPLYFPQFAIFWYIWAISMVIVRISIGVHYLSDILAGIILSLIIVGLGLIIGFLPIIPFTELI